MRLTERMLGSRSTESVTVTILSLSPSLSLALSLPPSLSPSLPPSLPPSAPPSVPCTALALYVLHSAPYFPRSTSPNCHPSQLSSSRPVVHYCTLPSDTRGHHSEYSRACPYISVIVGGNESFPMPRRTSVPAFSSPAIAILNWLNSNNTQRVQVGMDPVPSAMHS